VEPQANTPPPAFLLSRWVFLRLLGLTYLFAFISLASQVVGLVGTEGILPVEQYLYRLEDTYGTESYRLYPTLLWLSSSDETLILLCWLGALLSVMLILGLAPRAVLAALWISYLSLSIGGQAFLGFQWDSLLLETGLLACLYAPRGLWPTLNTEPPPEPTARWLIWWLTFRLIFLSGITKLASGDPTWADLTALTHHFETQPLPLWTSWYMHQLPKGFHQLLTIGMFVAELVLPFVVFLPISWIRLRQMAIFGLVLLQAAIGLSGNYGFFSCLSALLCLALVDDRTWLRILPALITDRAPIAESSHPKSRGWNTKLGASLTVLLFMLGGLTFAREISNTLNRAGRSAPSFAWSDQLIGWVQPFRSINGYGLFRIMTVKRPEIVIEVSLDGTQWIEWNPRWKPGDVHQRPRLVAPHQPRLDWNLWFAALEPQAENYWLSSLVKTLLANSSAVTALMGKPPFPDTGPAFIRLALYDYRFTTPKERARTGTWWHRQFLRYLTPPTSHNVQ